MLTKDPTKRPSLQWVKDHDWITNEGTEPMPEYIDHNVFHQSGESDYSGEDEEDECVASIRCITGDVDSIDLGLGLDSVIVSESGSSSEEDDSDDANNNKKSSKQVMNQKRKSNRQKSFSGNIQITTLTASDLQPLISTISSNTLVTDFNSHLEQGTPIYQEDRIYIDLSIHPSVRGFGILDGHGGEAASKTLLRVFPQCVRDSNISNTMTTNKDTKDDNSENKEVKTADVDMNQDDIMKNIFLNADACLLLQFEKEYMKSTLRDDGYKSLMKTTAKAKNVGCAGSTGTVLLLNQDLGKIGWLGDSRAVGVTKEGIVVELTQDHTAIREDEKKRVRAAGGTVDHKGRLNSTLAVSRGFGDRPHKKPLSKITEMTKRKEAQMASALLGALKRKKKKKKIFRDLSVLEHLHSTSL